MQCNAIQDTLLIPPIRLFRINQNRILSREVVARLSFSAIVTGVVSFN